MIREEELEIAIKVVIVGNGGKSIILEIHMNVELL